MKKKAEFLKQCLLSLKEGIDREISYNIPLDEDAKTWRGEGYGVLLSVREARALVEALESLRWVNLYDNLKNQRVLGNEHTAYNEAITIGFKRNSTDINYIETVGIIRLKDDEI